LLRRLVIICAVAVAAFALATASAGAGVGNLELYSEPEGGGDHSSVLPTTVESYLDECIDVSTLTEDELSEAQSADNLTNFSIELYGTANCTPASFFRTLPVLTQWTIAGSEPPIKGIKPRG
jgi:hypothetical protein